MIIKSSCHLNLLDANGRILYGPVTAYSSRVWKALMLPRRLRTPPAKPGLAARTLAHIAEVAGRMIPLQIAARIPVPSKTRGEERRC
jgi:hypothetical protein